MSRRTYCDRCQTEIRVDQRVYPLRVDAGSPHPSIRLCLDLCRDCNTALDAWLGRSSARQEEREREYLEGDGDGR